MNRLLMSGLAIGFFALAVGLSTTPLCSQETKKNLLPTIKEIMNEAHQCKTAIIREVRQEMEKEPPDWERIGARGLELVRVGKLLALNTPPKGTTESWAYLTGLYQARATVLVDAAKRKDLEEARLTSRRMHTMCASCHREHK